MAIPLHYQIAELVMDLFKEGTHRKTTVDRLDSGTIQQLESDISSFQLRGEIFISSADIYDDLTPAAIKLIIRIQKELEFNNPLWQCTDKHKRETRAALAKLRAKGIIYPIDHTDIYIINPAKIRKGRPLAVYGALYDYAKKSYSLDKSWKPTTDDIIKLRSPKTLSFIEPSGLGRD